jgi:hypothetical protein
MMFLFLFSAVSVDAANWVTWKFGCDFFLLKIAFSKFVLLLASNKQEKSCLDLIGNLIKQKLSY